LMLFSCSTFMYYPNVLFKSAVHPNFSAVELLNETIFFLLIVKPLLSWCCCILTSNSTDN
jgi:hypothetical protein